MNLLVLILDHFFDKINVLDVNDPLSAIRDSLTFIILEEGAKVIFNNLQFNKDDSNKLNNHLLL